MKLLLDENLSRRLVPFLQDLFPGSSQIVLAGLERATDRQIWQFARENGFVIVTNDADFEELSILLGVPPQVIWLGGANTSKPTVLRLLTDNVHFIHESVNEGRACIELTKGG